MANANCFVDLANCWVPGTSRALILEIHLIWTKIVALASWSVEVLQWLAHATLLIQSRRGTNTSPARVIQNYLIWTALQTLILCNVKNSYLANTAWLLLIHCWLIRTCNTLLAWLIYVLIAATLHTLVI